jgi:hypothetical protein
MQSAAEHTIRLFADLGSARIMESVLGDAGTSERIHADAELRV